VAYTPTAAINRILRKEAKERKDAGKFDGSKAGPGRGKKTVAIKRSPPLKRDSKAGIGLFAKLSERPIASRTLVCATPSSLAIADWFGVRSVFCHSGCFAISRAIAAFAVTFPVCPGGWFLYVTVR
jgi:hypothetical protein